MSNIDTLLDALTKLNNGKKVTIETVRFSGVDTWKIKVLGWDFRLPVDLFTKEKAAQHALLMVRHLGRFKRPK